MCSVFFSGKIIFCCRIITVRLQHAILINFAFPFICFYLYFFICSYFVCETLDIVSAPYSSDFVRILLPLVRNSNIIDESVREKLPAAQEFIQYCQMQHDEMHAWFVILIWGEICDLCCLYLAIFTFLLIYILIFFSRPCCNFLAVLKQVRYYRYYYCWVHKINVLSCNCSMQSQWAQACGGNSKYACAARPSNRAECFVRAVVLCYMA